jgi:hypothetical protein
MQNKPDSSGEDDPRRPSSPIIDTRIEPRGEVIVEHYNEPPKGPADKRIHQRRPLPLVPDRHEDDEPDNQTTK